MIDKETFKKIIEQEIIDFLNSNYQITYNEHDGYEHICKTVSHGIYGLPPYEHSKALFKRNVAGRYLHLPLDFKDTIIDNCIENWWNTTQIIQTLPKIPKL